MTSGVRLLLAVLPGMPYEATAETRPGVCGPNRRLPASVRMSSWP